MSMTMYIPNNLQYTMWINYIDSTHGRNEEAIIQFMV